MEQVTDNRKSSMNSINDDSKFLFVAASDNHLQWLGSTLGKWDILHQKPVLLPLLVQRICDLKPRLILLDFSGSDSAARIAETVELARELHKTIADLPLVAVGSITFPEGAVAALRAGIHYFIDVASNPEEARNTVAEILTRPFGQGPEKRGRLVTLLGTRVGVGTTTLAAHLADLLQTDHPPTEAQHNGTTEDRVALLDLGLPAGDGQVYLNVNSTFHFADAVRNLRRFDATLIHTALGRSRNGIKMLSLPQTAAEMRTLAQDDSVALLERLRSYFDVLIVDLGGFADRVFTSRIAAVSDQVWLITDQSVGALVSMPPLLQDLEKNQVDRRLLHLVVNRYDPRFGMESGQIAQRFDLHLSGVIPERTLELMRSTSQGRLLHEVAPRDPYVRAVLDLAHKISTPVAGVGERKNWTYWLPHFFARQGL